MSPAVDIAGSWFFEEQREEAHREEMVLSEDQQRLAVVSELGPSLARVQLMTRQQDPGLEKSHWGAEGPPILENSMADALSLAQSLLGLDGRGGAT